MQKYNKKLQNKKWETLIRASHPGNNTSWSQTKVCPTDRNILFIKTISQSVA
jgi:hypothetical protein